MDNLNANAEEIKNLFRNIHKKFRAHMEAQCCELHFTVPQMMVLQELYLHPEITLRELSAHVGLAGSTVCGIVDRLAAQGVVERVRDLKDRRTVKISLTPQITELTDTRNLIKQNYVAGLLQQVSVEDQQKIICGLRLLNELMEAQQKRK